MPNPYSYIQFNSGINVELDPRVLSHFHESNWEVSIFVKFWSGANSLYVSICLNNGLFLKMGQAITWTNVEPVHCGTYTSLGHNGSDIKLIYKYNAYFLRNWYHPVAFSWSRVNRFSKRGLCV